MSAAKDAIPARAAAVMDRLDRLGSLSDEPGRLTRLFLSEAHRAAAATVLGWMEAAGMAAHRDAVGNVVGRYAAAAPGAGTLILGSHIDTVRDAGRYDGCLGVVLAIEAVAALAAAGERLPFAVEVIAFGDEEGVRFPEALAGSSAVAGRFDPAVLDAADADGIPLGAALRAFGCDPAAIPALARRPGDVVGYVELHIEQGPVLEAEDLPVGVVTAIAGASRFRFAVSGVAGHAGTVPMRLRRDAFAAVAEMACALEALARDTPDLVATVGRVEVKPGAVNVIPSRVDFTVDLRSSEDATRLAAIAAMKEAFAGIAARRGVSLAAERFYDEKAARCSPGLRAALGRAVRAEGLRALELASGAGHDGLAMVGLCPIGMLFVRCAGGISHNPAESVAASDVAAALRVLLAFLRGFDPAAPPSRSPSTPP